MVRLASVLGVKLDIGILTSSGGRKGSNGGNHELHVGGLGWVDYGLIMRYWVKVGMRKIKYVLEGWKTGQDGG